MSIPQQIQDLITRGAMFVVNHSGGKDSQAMYLKLRKYVPQSQLVIVHADLGAVEWAGAISHIKATTGDEPLHVCRSRRTLLEMIEERGMFPSPEQRQCTSDLKRGPIERTIRQLVEERVAKFVGVPVALSRRVYGRKDALKAGCGLIVNCMGMRAQESSGRKKLPVFKFSSRNSKAGREWYDWLPIHDWTEDQVFAEIKAAGQEPHLVYKLGMRRFSCVFCIMASEEDLKTAARLATERPELLNDPELYRKYVGLEKSTGQVMLMPTKKYGRRTLEDVTGVIV
jgi:3'-phosphoadenosine 5'-phosphosulfate sulfotransferase (PAPS reductase)/FAD synthetase